MLPTTVIGSYPQPEWLIDRAQLANHAPPRVPAHHLWRIPEPFLRAAQDDATILAIRDQERAGIDIVADGEIRRESWSNRFAHALEGLDVERPAVLRTARGREFSAPRIVGPIRRRGPIGVDDVRFLRTNTDRAIKASLPGPFALASVTKDEHYGDERASALAFADAVNAEVRDLFAAGADVVQIDEPQLQSRPDQAREYGVEVVDRALHGVRGTTALHMCFGYAHYSAGLEKPRRYAYLRELDASVVHQVALEAAQPNLDLASLEELPNKTIILGVLDLSTTEIDSPEIVASRIRAALERISPERLMIAPDCGMKYLPREVAFRKLQALVAARDTVLTELG